MFIDDRTIVINIEKTERSEIEQEVISVTKLFLESEQGKLMNMCFSSIRDDDNERYFKESIDEIDDNEFDSLFPLVSNVILTANKIECDSLNYIISKQKNAYIIKRKHNLNIIPNHNVGAADVYVFKIDSFYLLHINAFDTGSNTPGGSTDIVRYISNNPLLKPTSIISFGVCYGRNPSKQKYGDVIIPQKLYPWSIGQKIVDKTLTIKNDDFNLRLFDLFDDNNIYSTLRDFCDGEDGRKITGSITLAGSNDNQFFSIKTIMGNMSTGEAVVSSDDAKRIIVEATSNYKELGGEMEGYGIAKECAYYANIPCVIIKSICDWGVLKNIEDILHEERVECPKYLKDKLQSYAAFCAGIILMDLYNKEKEIIFSLKLIDHVAQSLSGRNFLNGNTSNTKEKIKKFLKEFYCIDNNKANDVFDLLIKNEFLLRSPCEYSKYIVNQKLLKELTHRGYY